MPIRGLMLAFGAVLVVSLGMAAWQSPRRDLFHPANPLPSVLVTEKRDISQPYVETGSLRLALAWREAVRKQLRRVGSTMLRPAG